MHDVRFGCHTICSAIPTYITTKIAFYFEFQLYNWEIFREKEQLKNRDTKREYLNSKVLPMHPKFYNPHVGQTSRP